MNEKLVTRRAFLQRTAAVGAGCLSLGHLAATAQPAEEHAGDDPIRNSMARVAKCCLAWLNPEQHYLPTGGYEIAHDTGRWWDAMLRYEAATGTRIPQWAEEAMLENLRKMTDNPAALLLNEFGPPEAYRINLHNIRETMLTYAALAKYRNSAWAREQGRKLAGAIESLLNADGQLDYSRLKTLLAGKSMNDDLLMTPHAPEGSWSDSTGTTGRALEAVILFAEATGDTDAMRLAGRLADTHLRTIIDPSGKVRAELLAPDHVGHNHSYCGTLRGLLLYGLTTGESRYVDAVSRTYRNGLWGVTISHSGWTPHDLGKLRFPNGDGDPVGEHGSCSDVMLLGLRLGLRAGQADLLDDVERLLRARLFPSQMKDPANPRNDGAWGVYGDPFGYGSILDVFAAVLHCLADVSAHVVTSAPDRTISVNLHFSCDTPCASVQVRRDDIATTVVIPRQSTPVRIRVPGWAPRESVRLCVGGKTLPVNWDGPYLALDAASVAAGSPITLQHDLPRKETVEEMPVSHRKFRLGWRGDEVISCDPPVAIYPRQG